MRESDQKKENWGRKVREGKAKGHTQILGHVVSSGTGTRTVTSFMGLLAREVCKVGAFFSW
jgi:hypothetical protein